MTGSEPWALDGEGVLGLPDGRRVRGRGLRAGLPAGPLPTFGLYLLGDEPPATDWPQRWVRWPDFRVPADRDDALAAVAEAHDRAGHERVEVACAGGTGRTGAALAALAVRAGVAPGDAVAFVRAGYRRRAVETPGQRRWVRRLPPPPAEHRR